MEPETKTRDIVNCCAWAVIALAWPPITLVVDPGEPLIDRLIFVAITAAWAISPLFALRAWVRAKGLTPNPSWDLPGYLLLAGWCVIVVAEVAYLGTKLELWSL